MAISPLKALDSIKPINICDGVLPPRKLSNLKFVSFCGIDFTKSLEEMIKKNEDDINHYKEEEITPKFVDAEETFTVEELQLLKKKI